ncbi:MAG: cytochrome P450 [Chloroflexi bacterium]|nr:cytochrome P450 [Chloroflexota bacterium]
MMTKPTPPALPAPPLIGHTLEFQKDRQGLFTRGYQTLGQVFSIKLGTKPAAVLIGPEYHQIYFAETDKKLSTHKTYAMLKAIFGEVALAAPPDIYNEQRPVLYAPFKHERMVKYIPIMQQEVQLWIDALGASGEFELTAAFNSLVQNVAAHALMGKEFRDRASAEFWKQYAILGKSLDPLLPPNLPLPKFIRRDRAKQRLREMVQPIIDERRAHPEGHDDFLQTFVDARYKDGRPVENELILSLILGLMFAGHETTAGQAAWTIIQLLQHPGYRQLVQAELAEKLPPGTIIDMSVLSSLDHVWWAVQETTRMHPSAAHGREERPRVMRRLRPRCDG